MSIRIVLDNPPEFYTNQDTIQGHVVLSLSRHENVSGIVVKLEGESRTALGLPPENPGMGIARDRRDRQNSGDTLHENHKILYRFKQVFPDENDPALAPSYSLNPGQHRFAFQFKFPFNNACGDSAAMARIGGIAGAGGVFGPGFRVMDGTKQLMYSHVTKTLPPSFTGFPGEAEIRYYLKVTIQRPGFFKENWRYQMGLKFLPIEPPRPPKTNQEAYARRPFTFHPRSPSPAPYKKRSSFFGRQFSSGPSTPVNGTPNLAPPADGSSAGPSSPGAAAAAPSIEVSARLPHPAILTCNKPIPLRMIAKKLVPAQAEVYLIALQVELVGRTTVRCQNLTHDELSRWVIMAHQGLSVLVSKPDDPVGTEYVLPDSLWSSAPLPNTVMPSFVTCNLGRDYRLEIKLGLAWGKPSTHGSSFRSHRSKPKDLSELPQELHLPLQFSSVQVYSGMAPPPELVEAIRQGRGRTSRPRQSSSSQPTTQPGGQPSSTAAPPTLPPRRPSQSQSQSQSQQQQQQAQAAAEAEDAALYPPQLRPGQDRPPYDDAPPTYEEAMAEEMTGPMVPPAGRPAYSGVTDVNGPSSLPEKS